MHRCENGPNVVCRELSSGEFGYHIGHVFSVVRFCPICGEPSPKQKERDPKGVELPDEVNVDGYEDKRLGVKYIGKATKRPNGRYICAASGPFGFALVEVKITRLPEVQLWEGDNA